MSDSQLAEKLIEYLNAKPQSYSGRGMYGSSCLGFAYDTYQQYTQEALEVLYSAIEDYGFENTRMLEIKDALGKFASDSLGRGIIIYFPNLPGPELAEDEDEDED